MRRLALLLVLLVVLAVSGLPLWAADQAPFSPPAAAPGSAAPIFAPAPQPQANGCPLYRACMATPNECFCAGFFCNGHFICGIPVTSTLTQPAQATCTK